ncbi:VOC family protein [Bdellovibrio sp. HCB-162]|uniref:VOC family protein n=1 Tax=Bdellovibrio sp. HCB-162 TaxID=3394234 RepID=UPI0039BD69F0
MITGVQDIYYSVTQPKRAIQFYTEGLGMKLIDESEYWIALDCHGVKILGEDDQPWGHMLVFEDPDGNVLKLMNPKY